MVCRRERISQEKAWTATQFNHARALKGLSSQQVRMESLLILFFVNVCKKMKGKKSAKPKTTPMKASRITRIVTQPLRIVPFTLRLCAVP